MEDMVGGCGACGGEGLIHRRKRKMHKKRLMADDGMIHKKYKRRVHRAGEGVVAGGARSSYFDFVRKYHKKHPNLTWLQAVKKAKTEYHKKHGVAKKRKVVQRKRKVVHRKRRGAGIGSELGAKKGLITKLYKREIRHAPSFLAGEGEGVLYGGRKRRIY
jgi:hypothetical protein